MDHVIVTGHAIKRFRERFAGNLSWERATERFGAALQRT